MRRSEAGPAAPSPCEPVLPPGHLPPLPGLRPAPPALAGGLHWLTVIRPLLGSLKYAAGLAPLWTFDLQDEVPGIIPITAVYLITTAWRTVSAGLRYASFRYTLQSGQLILTWGVISHNKRVIPARKVVNLSITRSVWHRVFRAVELRLETAGGGGEDAVLEAVRPASAERLRQRLELLGAGESQAPARTRTLRHLGPATLILHGLTSNMFAAFGALAAFIYDHFWEAIRRRLEAVPDVDQMMLAAVVLLFLAWLGSMVLSLVRLWGFRLDRTEKGDLETHFGLLTVHQGRIFRGRVQDLVITESFLRRPFRLASIRVLSAAGVPGQEPDSGNEFLLPLARLSEVDELIAQVFPELDGLPPLQPVHPLAVRRNVLRLSLLPVVLLGGTALFTSPWVLAGLLLWLPLAPVLARRRYKNTGYALSQDFLVVRQGLFNRSTHLVPRAKLQTMTLHRNVFDRALGLCSLSLDTAARSAVRAPRIPDLEPPVALALREACLARPQRPAGDQGTASL